MRARSTRALRLDEAFERVAEMPFRNISLAELARHIGMDAREVRRMAERGQIPGKLVAGEWRFNRAEMLDWLQREMHALTEAQRRSLEQAMSDGGEGLLISGLIAPDGVDMNLPARSRASVIRELVRLAERTGLVWDAAEILARLDEREKLCSTALPGGIAFPHPRRPLPYATAEPLVCLARVAAGVPYGAPDGRLTYIFVFVCAHDDRQHLQILARLSLMFSGDLADRLVHVEDRDEAMRIVTETERSFVEGGP
ncbi:MAG: PTS fructose transporter subunit IIABC [Planctomycetota bacterium]|nr:MAG: PTS fructose transporter subunit IIABC [Planctomycetota bacterium]